MSSKSRVSATDRTREAFGPSKPADENRTTTSAADAPKEDLELAQDVLDTEDELVAGYLKSEPSYHERKKQVGFWLDRDVSEDLDTWAKKLNVPKSRLAEDGLKLLFKRLENTIVINDR